MKNNDEPGDSAPLDRRRLFEHALGGLSAWAVLRGLTACAAEEGQPLPQGAQTGPSSGALNPSAVSGVAGAGATSALPASTAPQAPVAAAPGMATPSANPAPTSTMAVPNAPSPGMSAPRAACEVVVTTFPNLADGGPSTSFTRMDQSSRADWIAIGGASSRLATKVADGILNLLQQLDKLYVGYPISVLAHSLQTATRAEKANASDDLVLSALCHDIGMAITVAGHAELSAAILRGYVSNEAYRVVRHHPEFEWMRGGAPTGQPTDQRTRYQTQSWFGDAARFIDEWESISYDPKFTSRSLKDFEALVRSKFGAGATVNPSTSQDCLPKDGGTTP